MLGYKIVVLTLFFPRHERCHCPKTLFSSGCTFSALVLFLFFFSSRKSLLAMFTSPVFFLGLPSLFSEVSPLPFLCYKANSSPFALFRSLPDLERLTSFYPSPCEPFRWFSLFRSHCLFSLSLPLHQKKGRCAAMSPPIVPTQCTPLRLLSVFLYALNLPVGSSPLNVDLAHGLFRCTLFKPTTAPSCFCSLLLSLDLLVLCLPPGLPP